MAEMKKQNSVDLVSGYEQIQNPRILRIRRDITAIKAVVKLLKFLYSSQIHGFSHLLLDLASCMFI